MHQRDLRGRLVRRAVLISSLVMTASAAAAAAPAFAQSGQSAASPTIYTSTVFTDAASITHRIQGGSEAIAQPDDITSLAGDVFVGFQNGVGPQGQPSSSGNLDSTIVEFSAAGAEVRQWDIAGKCDGLTGDPATGQLIATVNEDANSSIYLITPSGPSTPVHYHYNEPLPSDGGTDAISVDDGMVLVSASAPGTTGAPAPQPQYPAVYHVTFNALTKVARVRALFDDEALARVATFGNPYLPSREHLALTDPDSNEVVPSFAVRFAGDFMLTSQGDEEQIFVHNPGRLTQRLSVLMLSASVDDTTWPSDATGAILTTDNANDTVYKVTGPFKQGQVFAAETPCDENSAPSTCPGPGFPANFVAQLNPFTGVLTPITLSGPAPEAQGMIFMP